MPTRSNTVIDAADTPAASVGAVEIEHVSLSINGVSILSGIDLSVPQGHIVGLIGPNGAGKTSLMNVISGQRRVTGGVVRLYGNDVTRWPSHRRARLGLGRSFQTSSLFSGLTVYENTRLAVQAKRPGVYAAFRAVPRGPSSAEARRALEMVGLDDRADQLASSISHGDRRKLELAMIVAGGSRTLLLDEPMAGVGSGDVHGLVDLIRQIHQETSATILLVEHHLHVVLGLADRVAVLHHGALLAYDKPESVIADEVVQRAYIGDPL